ncbi:hypothetical protein [Mycolicibacterium llatzerense]|uniref:hypothetical protein n=1 Tax=Mycolicibacterium llatzerense TaxID=280871 RepID=UPI0021B6810C|nr:hypothetical protein [Mycolicibacterium llatzerense]MCT7369619.1 hypothetical protein [Mycolicibacterium llatzerense]
MPETRLTPAERRMRSQLGAHAQWARCNDRSARTASARAAFNKRFENQVDPDGVLDPAERARRATHARQAHMLKLALASAKARRLRAQQADIEDQLADEDPAVLAEAEELRADGGAA